MTPYVKAVTLWKDREVAAARDLAEALAERRAGYVFHSIRTGGDDDVTYDLVRQVLEHDRVSGYTGKTQTLLDLRGAVQAWELFLTAFDQRRPFSPELLTEFHARLTLAQPAELSPDMAAAVAELAQLLRGVRSQNVLVAAAYLLAGLEKLQPFARKTGATARAVTNYFLVLHDHPPVIFYEEDRRDYRTVINALDSGHHLAPLVGFLKEETAKTWADDIRHAGEIGIL